MESKNQQDILKALNISDSENRQDLKSYPAPPGPTQSEAEQEKRPSQSNGKVYIGTKVIRAIPMTEHEFLEKVKGKSKEELQQQETQGAGYKVIYEDGYVSWSPKRIFEQCYREVSKNELGLLF